MGNLCLQCMPVETPTLSCQATAMLLLRTQIRCRLQRCQVFQLCTFLHLIQGISLMLCMKQQPNLSVGSIHAGKAGFLANNLWLEGSRLCTHASDARVFWRLPSGCCGAFLENLSSIASCNKPTVA